MRFRTLRLGALVAVPLLIGACSEDDRQKTSAATQPTAASSQEQPLPLGTGFDFYVLALSWSPTWCAENDRSGRSLQCDRDRDNGFIVHGLWPQNERGYPEFCKSSEPGRVPDGLGRTMLDIMPSMGLIGHQWRKHGACSGLSQKDYFTVVRKARQRVAIPATLRSVAAPTKTSAGEMEKLLISANSGLGKEGLAVTCSGGRVEEVRICLDRTLNFRACPRLERAGCAPGALTLPPIP